MTTINDYHSITVVEMEVITNFVKGSTQGWMGAIFVCVEKDGHETVCGVKTAGSTEGLGKFVCVCLVNVEQSVSWFRGLEETDVDVLAEKLSGPRVEH